MYKDDAYSWLNDNAAMYRGNNASDCMIAAFCAGAKLVEEKFTSTNTCVMQLPTLEEFTIAVCSCDSSTYEHDKWLVERCYNFIIGRQQHNT